MHAKVPRNTFRDALAFIPSQVTRANEASDSTPVTSQQSVLLRRRT
jgi:hypothetical protein